MDTLARTPRTTLHRRALRGSYDRAVIDSILDEALICHVGFVVDGEPIVTPTIHTRIGDQLYLHGSIASRTQKALGAGVPVCITVTLVDALVLARSAFHHSMNYRSVMLFGTAFEVSDIDERCRALEALVNHVVPGRAAQVRAPNQEELNATSVVRVPIVEASAKIRVADLMPVDLEADYTWPCWAGLLPLRVEAQTPLPDNRLIPGTPVPQEIARYTRRRAR
jgi:nitroimidazol reductase NimA-like FMN-containing flavoprotein (pyridoxamine 5'-phosphate oxidase superfamily)